MKRNYGNLPAYPLNAGLDMPEYDDILSSISSELRRQKIEVTSYSLNINGITKEGTLRISLKCGEDWRELITIKLPESSMIGQSMHDKNSKHAAKEIGFYIRNAVIQKVKDITPDEVKKLSAPPIG